MVTSLANHVTVYGNVPLNICTGKAWTKGKRKDFSDFAYQIILFFIVPTGFPGTPMERSITALEGAVEKAS